MSNQNPTTTSAAIDVVERSSALQTGLRFIRFLFGARETGIALVVIILGVILSLSTPYFLTASNLAIVARQVSLSAIIAMGMTLVILLGGIDLSVGSVVAFTSVVIGYVMVRMQMPIWAGILAGLSIGVLVGMVNGGLVIKTGVPPFIVTLGMMGLARGAALVITKGSTISGLPPQYLMIGQGYILGTVPIPVIIMLVIAVILHIVLSRTTFGRRIYFIGSNEEAALLSGINVNQIKVIVFTLCAALASSQAVIETARMSTAQPASGIGYELTAIGAVIIGGASMKGGEGTILGTILGATLLGMMTNGLILVGVSAYWQQVFSGGIIIVAVALDTWRRARR
jgi:ribose/xylose/arabinose/galactoside ABC-type transport system permease subunit